MKIYIKDLLKELDLREHIPYNSIPDLDLYIDQVITLFENTLPNSKRYADDKILTKTMINNYSKDKLLMRPINKKYSKDHIILMLLIYCLKQSLSIGDIKILFKNILSEKNIDTPVDLKSIYTLYLSIKEDIVSNCEDTIIRNVDQIEKKINNIFSDENNYIKKLITVLYLIENANAYKRTAEKLIDSLIEN